MSDAAADPVITPGVDQGKSEPSPESTPLELGSSTEQQETLAEPPTKNESSALPTEPEAIREPASATSGVARSMWGWFEKASVQAKGIKDMAQDRAVSIAKQANEIRQNYDFQVASEALMQGMGATSVVGNKPAADNQPTAKMEQTEENQLDLHYITENIITMSFPYTARTKPKGLKKWNNLEKAAAFLKEKHKGRYMIWNVSEDPYDYSAFEDQVLEYKFPGHPAPPLGLLFKICAAVESWLDADRKNVAVVHCLTGKGRTGSILACVLAWIGEFSSPLEALSYVANRRGLSVEELTIPSQRRYVQYFSNVLDGVKPRSDPLLLRRVIMNTIPQLGGPKDGSVVGCCPYLQIFKNGTLLANSYIPSKNSKQAINADSGGKAGAVELKWISTSEGSISFHMDVMIHGDVLIRCRHIDLNNGKRESMFRAAFHTGYTPIGVLRLTKAQLDGCDTDDRFDDDFFVDFIFAPVEKKDTNGKTVPLSTELTGEQSNASSEATGGQKQGEASDSGLVVDSEVASKFDEMLHRDGRFWDKIAMRKNRATTTDSKKRKSRKFATSSTEVFSISDESFEAETGPENASSKLVAKLYDDSSFLLDDKASNKPSVREHADSSELSDMELIMQLAKAEGDQFNDSKTGVEISSSESGIAVVSSTPDANCSEANSATVQESDGKVANNTTGSAAGDASKGSSTNEAGDSFALEDFERELGLMSSSVVVDKTTVKTSEAAPSSDIDGIDDNLDELEKYLQSLGSS